MSDIISKNFKYLETIFIAWSKENNVLLSMGSNTYNGFNPSLSENKSINLDNMNLIYYFDVPRTKYKKLITLSYTALNFFVALEPNVDLEELLSIQPKKHVFILLTNNNAGYGLTDMLYKYSSLIDKGFDSFPIVILNNINSKLFREDIKKIKSKPYSGNVTFTGNGMDKTGIVIIVLVYIILVSIIAFFVYYIKRRRIQQLEDDRRRRLLVHTVAISVIPISTGNEMDIFNGHYDFRPENKKILDTLDETSQNTCSICLDDFKLGDKLSLLGCDHCFHTDCVNTWFTNEEGGYSCPYCRRYIFVYNDYY